MGSRHFQQESSPCCQQHWTCLRGGFMTSVGSGHLSLIAKYKDRVPGTKDLTEKQVKGKERLQE